MAQYGIRLRDEADMPWDEFQTLLAGIMPKTPLGQIVSIRTEEDKEILKHFTPQQRRLRSEWQRRQAERMSEAEKQQVIAQLERAFSRAYGG